MRLNGAESSRADLLHPGLVTGPCRRAYETRCGPRGRFGRQGTYNSRMLVRDAATVMLLRDAPDLEVFMLRRNPMSVFAAGAYVFPGGAVDVGDSATSVAARVSGIDEEAAGRSLALREGALAFWVAAIRETFEEAGLLLAEPRSGSPFEAGRIEELRRDLNAGEASWEAMLESEDLVMRGGDLKVFAHFLTPEGAPRRYDTWFFAAPAPSGQVGAHDDGEAVHSEWVTPSSALDRYRSGGLEMISPTLFSLGWLSRFGSAAEVLAAADAAAPSTVSAPLVVPEGFGERIALDDAERSAAVPGWRPLSMRYEMVLDSEGVA